MKQKTEGGKNILGKPLLENVFGENNPIKVLDFLIMGNKFDFTLSQISKGTNLSRTAVKNAIDEFMKNDLVVVSRTEGISQYYQINRESKKFDVLLKLYGLIQEEIILQN